MTTDLSIIQSCEILEDNEDRHHFQNRIAGGAGSIDDDDDNHDEQYDSGPEAYGAPAAPLQLVSADSVFEAAPSYGSPPEKILEKPRVELRTFFPENWLFDLQFTNDTVLSR